MGAVDVGTNGAGAVATAERKHVDASPAIKPEPQPSWGVCVDGREFGRILAEVCRFAATDESRPALNAVSFEVTRDRENRKPRLTMTAADGYRLISVRYLMPGDWAEFPPIPGHGMAVNADPADVVDAGQWLVPLDDAIAFAKLLKGQPAKSVMPKMGALHFGWDTAAAGVVGIDGKTRPPKIVTAALMRQTRATVEQSLCVDAQFPSWEQLIPPEAPEGTDALAGSALSLNYRFVGDVARVAGVISGANILKIARLQGGTSPARFEAKGLAAEAVMVVMPMHSVT